MFQKTKFIIPLFSVIASCEATPLSLLQGDGLNIADPAAAKEITDRGLQAQFVARKDVINALPGGPKALVDHMKAHPAATVDGAIAVVQGGPLAAARAAPPPPPLAGGAAGGGAGGGAAGGGNPFAAVQGAPLPPPLVGAAAGAAAAPPPPPPPPPLGGAAGAGAAGAGAAAGAAAPAQPVANADLLEQIRRGGHVLRRPVDRGAAAADAPAAVIRDRMINRRNAMDNNDAPVPDDGEWENDNENNPN